MGLVKGDRIVVSQKLTQPVAALGGRPVSKEAYLSYAFFVSTLRDDFGRGRYNARTAAAKLAEERPDITEKDVGRLLEEYRAAGLLRVWTADGRDWFEWVKAVRTGNRYHGTPEPPAPDPSETANYAPHVHNGSCLRTAIRQATACGDHALAERLSRQLRGLEPLDPDQKPPQRAELRLEQDSGPSSASSASSAPTDIPPHPPARAGGAPVSESQARNGANRLQAHRRKLGLQALDPYSKRRVRELLREGVPLQRLVDQADAEAAGGREAAASEEAWKAKQRASAEWVEKRGGPARLEASIADWIARNARAEESEPDALRRWANDPNVPEAMRESPQILWPLGLKGVMRILEAAKAKRAAAA